MLLFGNGWENIVFAVQVTYNLSLVAFLAHLVLVDHDGPVGRRDVAGSVVGMIGVSSSAFGPFFAAGVFAVLCWRRRWRAAAVAVVPQAIVYSWWLFTWGSDPAGDEGRPSLTGALKFARLALTATFNGDDRADPVRRSGAVRHRRGRVRHPDVGCGPVDGDGARRAAAAGAARDRMAARRVRTRLGGIAPLPVHDRDGARRAVRAGDRSATPSRPSGDRRGLGAGRSGGGCRTSVCS